MRKLNLVFLTVLVVGTALFGGGMHLVHQFQVQHNATTLLKRACRDAAGYDLRLMSWGDGSGVPASGKDLVVVGIDNNGLLHIRDFDADGNRATDTDETKLRHAQAGGIAALKQRLPGLLPPHVLTSVETARVNGDLTSILGQTHKAGKRLARAEEALGWYLSLRPDDGATWAWYARLVDRSDSGRRQVERTYLIHEQALRHAPDDQELKRRCADLAMEMRRFGDARSLLEELLGKTDTKAAARAEMEDLIGQCDRALGEHAKAEEAFKAAIEHDPHQVDCYDRLARLLRIELRRNAAADVTIKEMLAKNPDSGRAHALRWRYAEDFSPPADPRGIKKALALAPDDREVLMSAILDGKKRRDSAAIRTYLEEGNRRFADDPYFAIDLARIEARDEGHPDRAEAVLRRTFEVKPVAAVAFELADILIQQKKIEQKDEAADLINRLRAVGLGDTLVQFLEAEVSFKQEKWAEAIARLEAARTVLGSMPELAQRTDFMLAACYGRLGNDEQRLDALRRVAEGGRGADSTRMELVRGLAQSGNFDQAISTLSPIAAAGSHPEWRLDLVRLLLQKTVRQPRDRRNWPELEAHLRDATKAIGETAEPVVLLRLDVLTAEDRLDDARAMVTKALASEPRNLGYRLAMARVTQRQGRDDEALRIIAQAEKDLGPSPRIALARLDYWGQRGGEAARAAVANLATARGQLPADDRPRFLDRLGTVAIGLGRPDLARQYWRELAELQPVNVAVRLGLFDLAVMAGDRDEPAHLVEAIRRIEGETGTNWRFARAALLLDRVGRGASEGLEEASRLVAEITAARPNWWVGPTLNGQIAELAGSTDQAIGHYLRALDLGNIQPSFTRRLVALIDQQGRTDDVGRVNQVLRDQGAALAEVTMIEALDAIHKRDFDRGIALARQVFPENSLNAADHLNLGRIYMAAGKGDRAGQEFHSAVELGRGVPENWLALVEYLVQARQLEQARAKVEAASKALPADRATLTLARCFLIVGDFSQAAALVKRAMDAEGKADDPAALRLAIEVSLRQNRFDQAQLYVDRVGRTPTATPAVQAALNRTRAGILLASNRPAQALTLVNRNLASDPGNLEDQSLKAAILVLRPSGRNEAVSLLERLAQMNRLSDDQRFLLAQLHLGQGAGAKYEGEMLGLLNRNDRNPRHLAHFVNHWIDRNRLDQANRWLAELKKADPRGRPALECEARLLVLRKRRPELLALLEARGREIPDQVGAIADLLNRYGFVREAEAAYKAFIARDPKQPERALALAQFLVFQDRVPEAMEILKKARTTCQPEQVAAAAVLVFDAPSANDLQRREVEAWVAEAVKKRPSAVALLPKLGAIWMRQGRFDEAETLYRRIVGDKPDDADALNNLAWLLALRGQGKVQEALGLINHAIDVTGAMPSLIDTRAVARIQLGQIDQAIADLLVIRKQSPQNPSFALHLAWAYQVRGDNVQARRLLQEAEQIGLRPGKLDPLELAIFQRFQRELSPG